MSVSLLNGAQSGPDGMDFNGNRPTKITDTSPYTTTDLMANALAGNAETNVIGNDLPLGLGRPNGYVYSLMMLAKVSPPAATNMSYGWGRVYQDQSVTILFTSTNTWYVNSVGTPTGVPPPPVYDTQMNTTNWVTGDGFYTTTPSTNNNVIAFYDNPAMALQDFTNYPPQTNVWAYEKTDFTYFVTNYIGATNAVATQHVGQVILAKRTGTSGVITNDWTGVYNIASTTNIPNCLTVSTNEIRTIVSPSTNRIIFDPSVPSSP